MTKNLLFNPPKWCESFSFIIELSKDGNHEICTAPNTKDVFRVISEKFTDDVTSVRVDVVCSGHNQGDKNQSHRRQIKCLWDIKL